MLTIDELREPDLPAALRLSTQAGWNQTPRDWQRLLALWPGMALAGRLDGELVATATLAAYDELAWVGMVLVDERYRGRGFGGKILDAVMDLGRGRGVREFGLDATPLGRPMYLKRGFQDFAAIDRWVRAKPVVPAPSATLAAVRGIGEADWEAVVALDRSAAGVDRGALLRHLMREPGVRGWLLEESGSVRAFAILRPGRFASCAGPVIGEGQGASALLDAMLHELDRLGAQAILIDVPRDRLAEWLEAHGFEMRRDLVRMGTGSGRGLLQPTRRVAAICALELG